jgi:septal ring factor EnvC (AmiA/AmiB activator)
LPWPFPLVNAQQHLKAVRNELGRTNEQVVKLEKVVGGLKTEVDEANKARTDIQGKLDEANSTIEQLRKDLATSQSQLKEKDADD